MAKCHNVLKSDLKMSLIRPISCQSDSLWVQPDTPVHSCQPLPARGKSFLTSRTKWGRKLARERQNPLLTTQPAGSRAAGPVGTSISSKLDKFPPFLNHLISTFWVWCKEFKERNCRLLLVRCYKTMVGLNVCNLT